MAEEAPAPTLSDAEMDANAPPSESHEAPRSDSPKRKNPFAVDGEQRLVPRDPDEPPAWVEALRLSLKHEAHEIGDSVKTLGSLLERESNDRQRDVADLHKRLDELNGRLESVVKSMPAPSYRAVPPPQHQHQHAPQPDPWAGYARTQQARANDSRSARPTSPDREGPDYNHIVMGQWPLDTPRREILAAVSTSIAGWDVKSRDEVVRTMVWGQRARTAHVILKALPQEEAKERFFDLQEKHGARIATGTDQSWYSPNKSADVRKKNRSTRRAKEIIEAIKGSPLPSEDVDWPRQLMWCGKARIAAPTSEGLFAAAEARVISRTLQDEYGEKTTFYFNVSALSTATGKSAADVEKEIHES